MSKDPYKSAEAAFAAHDGLPTHHAVRAAVTAALIAERKRTIAFWLCRLRQRVIWFGGWEEPNCGGWRFRMDSGRWRDPLPLSIFHTFTHYGWGWQLRLPGTIFVRSRNSGTYMSPDGTPNRATRWFGRRPRIYE